VDYAGIIRRWVEQGEAPSRIVARKLRGMQVVRMRPLCARGAPGSMEGLRLIA
jgi:hypothetical protein